MNNQNNVRAFTAKSFGIFIGPLAAVSIFLLFQPPELNQQAVTVAAIAVWMAIWWATEATNVAVTALLPLVIFPVLGVSTMAEVARSYAHPIVYLFLGGFIVAIAIQKSGLHERIALFIFYMAGVNASAIVGGFMLAAALISMWVSNTSTTLMMLPIAISLIHVVRRSMAELTEQQGRNFEVSMFLGLAYGSTCGGVATLVGTPPNVLMAGFMQSTYNIEIDFARWMIIGLPLAAIMLPVIWFMLVKVLYPVNFVASDSTRDYLASKFKGLGPLGITERRTAILFALLVLGWLLRKPIMGLINAAELSDALIAMTAAIAAFLIPSGKGSEALISWEDTKQLPWGVLILFGGGLALATAMTNTELTLWLGQQLSPLVSLNTALFVLASCAFIIFLTELTSNTATTATFLPVMAALAIETGNDPLIFVIPMTLATSFAFMLPVATPPNAIVFSSGYVSIRDMMRAGFILNLIGVVLLSVLAVTLVPYVFG